MSGDVSFSLAIRSIRPSGHGLRDSGLRCFPALIGRSSFSPAECRSRPLRLLDAHRGFCRRRQKARGDRASAADALLYLLALKYNANSIFLSLWPWTMHFFVRAIDNRRLSDAILFGLFMGMALLSKYFALILAATCFAAALVHPKWRAYFTSASPYVSLLVATLVSHLMFGGWCGAMRRPWITSYTRQASVFAAVILSCVTLLAGVVAFHSIVMVLIALAKRSSPKSWVTAFRVRWAEPRFRVLTTLAVLPLGLTVVAGLVFRLRPDTNMTIGIFSLMPLLFIELTGAEGDGRLYRVVGAIAVACHARRTGAVSCDRNCQDLVSAGTSIIPNHERSSLARQRRCGTRPPLTAPICCRQSALRECRCLLQSRPSACFHTSGLPRAPWVTAEDLDRAGLLVVCSETDRQCLHSAANISTPRIRRTDLSLVHSFLGYTVGHSSFVITIVPPHL